MKVTKNGIKIHQAVFELGWFQYYHLRALFGSPKFFNLRKNLYLYAIETSKISILIDFEVRNSKMKLDFGKLQR